MAFPIQTTIPLNLESFGVVRDLRDLLDEVEPAIGRAFIRSITEARLLVELEEVSRLVESGRLQEAAVVVEQVTPSLMEEITTAYAAAGVSAAAIATRSTGVIISFDSLNARSVDYLRATELDLVRSLRDDTRRVLQQVLIEGVNEGLAPVVIARRARASIGLTPAMQVYVDNYRRELETRSSRSLGRALRDRRFDPTVARSIREATPLTPTQIDRMVDRYRDRWIKFRSETIALTEAQRALHAADEELWLQVVQSGQADSNEVSGTWVIRGDGNERASHAAMSGQRRVLGQPFRSGAGNSLRFPGDPRAPSSDTIRCRCVISRTLRR